MTQRVYHINTLFVPLSLFSVTRKAKSSGNPIMHRQGVELSPLICYDRCCAHVKYTPPALILSNLPKYEYQYRVGIFIVSFFAATRKFGVGILPTCCLCILALSMLQCGSCVRNTRNFKKKRTLLVGDAQQGFEPRSTVVSNTNKC
jgi:hypothetical protein